MYNRQATTHINHTARMLQAPLGQLKGMNEHTHQTPAGLPPPPTCSPCQQTLGTVMRKQAQSICGTGPCRWYITPDRTTQRARTPTHTHTHTHTHTEGGEYLGVGDLGGVEPERRHEHLARGRLAVLLPRALVPVAAHVVAAAGDRQHPRAGAAVTPARQ